MPAKTLKLYNIIYIICKIKWHVLNPIVVQYPKETNLFNLPIQNLKPVRQYLYLYLANVYANI